MEYPSLEQLAAERDALERRLTAINQIFDGYANLDKVNAMGDIQPEIPAAGRFADLGVRDTVRAILEEGKNEWWDLDTILKIATDGGFLSQDRGKNPRNNIGTQTHKLVKQKELEKRRYRGRIQYRFVPPDNS